MRMDACFRDTVTAANVTSHSAERPMIVSSRLEREHATPRRTVHDPQRGDGVLPCCHDRESPTEAHTVRIAGASLAQPQVRFFDVPRQHDLVTLIMGHAEALARKELDCVRQALAELPEQLDSRGSAGGSTTLSVCSQQYRKSK